MDQYLDALATLIAKRDAAILKIEAWIVKGDFKEEDRAKLFNKALSIFESEKASLLGPHHQASSTSTAAEARSVSAKGVARKVQDSTPPAPSVSFAKQGRLYPHVKSPEIESTPRASTTIGAGTAGPESSSPAVNTPVAAPAPQVINLVSQDTNPPLLTKRNRLATEIFDPSDVRSIREANEYRTSEQNRAIAATTTHAQIEAYSMLRAQYGWKKSWGFGEYRDNIILNPNGKPFRKKHSPVLGVDFFHDAHQALTYANLQAFRQSEYSASSVFT